MNRLGPTNPRWSKPPHPKIVSAIIPNDQWSLHDGGRDPCIEPFIGSFNLPNNHAIFHC